ncbi:MAG: hypothetical protein ACYC61_30600 [Isosphaeraceae bacterium]
MFLVPGDWSVVILGAWNRAILTPSGISKRLFRLPEGTQVEVMVPIDVMAPFRVKHEDVSVSAAAESLVVIPAKSTFANLGRALEIANRAMDNLPETPVSAAGINLKYKSKQPVRELARLLQSPLDQSFSAQTIEVVSRTILRSVRWKQGEIRIAVSQEPDQAYSILLNVHMEGDTTGKLKEWLSVSLEETRRQVETILFDCLGLSEGDIGHAEEAD